MTMSAGLNERAADPGAGLAPLWYLGSGVALFAGPLNRNAPHRHSVPVLLAGLYGSFRLRVGAAGWCSCRTAVIPAGVEYEFDMGGEPLGVFYLEPNVAGIDALIPLAGDTREVSRALIGGSGEVELLRRLYEDHRHRPLTAEALSDLVAFADTKAARRIDPRIVRAVEALQGGCGERVAVEDLARGVGLSASRFQHLFTREVGVPFRRYRSWHRLRAALREIVQGTTFAHAAYAAGFSDQAHFAREFRRTFGAPAWPGLAMMRRA